MKDQDIGDTFGAALALDPNISSLLFSQNNLGIDDIAIFTRYPKLLRLMVNVEMEMSAEDCRTLYTAVCDAIEHWPGSRESSTCTRTN